MPANTKHDALLTQIPTARKALAVLRAAGHSDLAATVGTVIDYAKEQAERGVAKNARDKGLGTHSIRMSQAFGDHVRAALTEDDATVADIVEKSFLEFLSGDWTPAAPTRARRGSSTAKASLSVRLKDDTLWEQVNNLGKDPAAVAERGYKVTAESVAKAAMEETFGLPTTEQASTTA